MKGRVRGGRRHGWPNKIHAHPSIQHNTDQVLFDLGCGDGRVCIEAAKATGARAVGERLID